MSNQNSESIADQYISFNDQDISVEAGMKFFTEGKEIDISTESQQTLDSKSLWLTKFPFDQPIESNYLNDSTDSTEGKQQEIYPQQETQSNIAHEDNYQRQLEEYRQVEDFRRNGFSSAELPSPS
jgi:hypothetical protein